MPAPVFPFLLQPSGNTRDVQYRIRQAGFGDGYKTKTPDGMNFREKSATLETIRALPRQDRRTGNNEVRCLEDIEDFLDERGGTRPFYVAIPALGRIDLVTCSSFSQEQEGGDSFTVSIETEPSYLEYNAYQENFSLFGGTLYDDLQALEDFING